MKFLLERYVTKNWKLKLLSLVLAIMLWYTVFQIGEPKKDLTVPVSLVNLSKYLVVMKMDPERVFITVSGRVSLLKDLKENGVHAVINMNGAKEGEAIFDLSKSTINVPKGIEIVDVRPGTLRVTLDRITEKRLKIVPVLDRKWTGRYDIVQFSPQFAIAEGPRKSLEKVTTIETLPVHGDFKRNEENISIGFNVDDLPKVRMKPENVRIILKKRSGKDIPAAVYDDRIRTP
ncbi:MAG: CdaR family protein [Syntrophorhabdaceae bacterium]